MINIEHYISQLIPLLRAHFGSRLIYVGLQGSYFRGEATEDSDIDIMTVIEGLSAEDLTGYRSVIRTMPCSEKSCGFICSREDLKNWNPLEIWNLINGTRDCFGTLRELVPDYTEEDVRNYVKLSINNLYHELCHRYIHGDPANTAQAMPRIYKGVFFILQNLQYLREGHCPGSKAELLELLHGKDRAVMQRSLELGRGVAHDFTDNFQLLFSWCQETLNCL